MLERFILSIITLELACNERGGAGGLMGVGERVEVELRLRCNWEDLTRLGFQGRIESMLARPFPHFY